jgi:hypothetical protein
MMPTTDERDNVMSKSIHLWGRLRKVRMTLPLGLLMLPACARRAENKPNNEVAVAQSSWTWDVHRPWNWVDAKPVFASTNEPHAETLSDAAEADDTGGDKEDAEQPICPIVTLSANGLGGTRLYQGWPLFIESRLMHPEAYTRGKPVTPLILSAADGNWPMSLQLRKSGGDKIDWPLHRAATQAAPALTLDNQTAGVVGWWLTPDETGKLPAGEHVLVAVLDTTASTHEGAWKGKVESDLLEIQVAPEPTTLTPADEEDKQILLAGLASLRGDPKEALGQVDALLKKQPNSIRGQELKADLLLDSGQTLDAMRLYDGAIIAFQQQSPGGKEPPVALYQKLRNALNRQRK